MAGKSKPRMLIALSKYHKACLNESDPGLTPRHSSLRRHGVGLRPPGIKVGPLPQRA
jgi:hypothetical protein